MANFVDWNKELETGNVKVDEQHKKLVRLLNELHAAMREGKAKLHLSKVLKDLVEYTDYHFKAEEELFSWKKYPAETEHKKIHKDLTDQVIAIQAKFETGNVLISVELLNFLKNWLVNHIMNVDKKAAEYMDK